MYCKFATILLLLTCIASRGNAQCTTLGQTPQTAFPVCGTSAFTQNTVPICTNGVINVPGCEGQGVTYADINPFWYRFTCYQAGTLGFVITPFAAMDDYDWQLFDITGHNPQDVYTDYSLFVCGNWAGTYAPTGASSAGTANVECASDPTANENTFTARPTLVVGHVYLLLISHYTQTQSGYTLSFAGGTAVITDTTRPALVSAVANCAGTKIGIKLSKNTQCASLDPNGSDFAVSPASATVIAASGNNCNNGFDMDSVVLTLSNVLPAGSYNVVIKRGGDLNTLLDNCGDSIPAGDSLPFGFAPGAPVSMDSLSPVGCAPATLQLVFKKGIMCQSIASDGSDFFITGPYPVNISSAGGSCNANGLSSIVVINLSAPIVHAGTYKLHLKVGDDGNTLEDECGEFVPAGETLMFTCGDTVSAAFNMIIDHGCVSDTVLFSNAGGNGITTWQWLFNDGYNNNKQGFTRVYTDSGQMTARLKVSNGFCSDSSSQSFIIAGKLKAAFTYPAQLCPNDTAVFKDASTGYITAWAWYFDNGQTSNQENPPFEVYAAGTRAIYYSIRLVVQNNALCYDTVYHDVKVLSSCYIAVPSAFTPNGDGFNDYLYPLNAYKAVNLEFRVFNRWGQQVFETRDWTRKWDGTLNGLPQANGVYVWMLSYTDGETGKFVQQKGTTVLIR